MASISHIAHLQVTTRTKDSSCAFRAHYDSGRLAPAKPGQSVEPKPIAGRPGTQITVEDLFYNVPTRRRAFRSASDEYNKILDMVGRYAVHCDGVAFSCKKHGEAQTGISTQSTSSTIDRIRKIHGGAVANELIKIESTDDRWGFTAHGYTTNANYHVKKTTLLLFINHRSVESTNIRRAIEQTYSTFLPKGGHPFTYISLDIDPQRVDVNVHPTKREVNFLNEDEILEKICDDIRVKLGNVDTSRTFMTQSLLPGARVPSVSQALEINNGTSARGDLSRATPKPNAKPHENNLVRTDAKLRTITSMLPPSSVKQRDSDTPAEARVEYRHSERELVPCRLITVKELRADVREAMHNELTEIFAGHTFVGIVDERRRLAAIQSGVKLFLVDYGMVSSEYFYQVGLTNFGNFGVIRFDPPMNLKRLLRMAADHEKSTSFGALGYDFESADVVELVTAQLIERREMLSEYFSFEVSEEGDIVGIPLLLKGYTPSLAKLPRFLLRLGPHVNWMDEKECFATFLRELASYYVPERLPPSPGPDDQEQGMDENIKSRRDEVRYVVENVLFPAFRARLVATHSLMKGSVLEVANLKGLYRVFERC